MDRQLLVKYIFYFFSYLLVYIPSFPILVVLIMAGASPNKDHHVLEWIIIGFEVFVTIFGSWLLNFIFRKTRDLKWNDRYSLMIFSLHLILIPLTWKLWM
ncbi:hypothetical protein COK88_24450 [Bacillus cereus]|uniref:hypothetical protein n=1 Tax=Bacillus cereus TaxID=1396 RepID=UPI000BF57E98|nr:hypothetical protein [Bacillus cereus]PFU46625.1 hypothetical protein COK88_24450 [Bacillus cereus]